ncbi:hypothetical protein [Mycoplasma struthionis]|uniref:Uncharacterized protein n=1 Tax=Mycoplasma struthionis TaxID=538220 RepID=A0A3G8LJD8_9MOLU|nr:hypothetical protein [Mycoplasma struthionis]AZG68758.1 hypothetical protein EGN60_02170 [Mycoplasma struthionis]TPI01528.1 hypothetical protein FJM01_02030 [Mycoplasma struthionis]
MNRNLLSKNLNMFFTTAAMAGFFTIEIINFIKKNIRCINIINNYKKNEIKTFFGANNNLVWLS